MGEPRNDVWSTEWRRLYPIEHGLPKGVADGGAEKSGGECTLNNVQSIMNNKH